MTETWDQIKDRHALERAEALTAHRDKGLTQAEAARELDMTPQALNMHILRNDIQWTASRQGRTKETPHNHSEERLICTEL